MTMTENETNSSDWCIECSDDELKDASDPWEPDPAEIHRIYSSLSRGETPEIKWKCPGYGAPSPERVEETKIDNPDQNKQQDEQDDFDFMDEMASPKLKIRQKGGESLKGSAKKKTTSLDGVLNNMRRHHLLPSSAK